MLHNVRRDVYQTFLQTPVDELMKNDRLLKKLQADLPYEEDLDYLVLTDSRLWQDFLRFPDHEEVVTTLKQSFLENAVFKFSNAEVTAKLMIPNEIYEEVGL